VPEHAARTSERGGHLLLVGKVIRCEWDAWLVLSRSGSSDQLPKAESAEQPSAVKPVVLSVGLGRPCGQELRRRAVSHAIRPPDVGVGERGLAVIGMDKHA